MAGTMGNTPTTITAIVAAGLALAGCSGSENSQPPKPEAPPPGVLVIDPAGASSLGRTVESYRIGEKTIPDEDMTSLAAALKAVREAFPEDEVKAHWLIVQADAGIPPAALAPVVMTAINSGYAYVDLDANLPQPNPLAGRVSDTPPPDPIQVRIYQGSGESLPHFEMSGIGAEIKDERKLGELLKERAEQLSRIFREVPIEVCVSSDVDPLFDVAEEFILAAYAQAIGAGYKRFGGRELLPRMWPPPGPEPLPDPTFEPGDLGGPGPLGPSKTRPATFFDVAADANHVVYISDCSGSLAPIFAGIQMELLRSIAKLHPRLDFAVLLMTSAAPRELDRNGLLPATLENKLKVHAFLQDLTATGATTAMPSLKRAFDLLDAADANSAGKVIYLVSDGDFVGLGAESNYKNLPGNEAVIEFLRDRNADKGVKVNSILLFNEDEVAKKVYKRIADDSGGTFRFVSGDDW